MLHCSITIGTGYPFPVACSQDESQLWLDALSPLLLTYHIPTVKVCRNANSCHPVHLSVNTWQPCISCSCHTHLEHSSVFAKSCSVTDVVQTLPENRTVRQQLHLTLSVLSTCVFSDFNSVQCPRNSFAVPRHLNHLLT